MCAKRFGNATFKLQLPNEIAYTLRNAAELFLAASAPAGFVGNSFSTFAKAVALLRAQRHAAQPANAAASSSSPAAEQTASLGVVSYAYDCAAIEKELWRMPKGRPSISLAHPGFEQMSVLQPSRCGLELSELASPQGNVLPADFYARRRNGASRRGTA